MQTDRSEGRTQMNPVRVASECQRWAALQFQQELCSFFFFFKVYPWPVTVTGQIFFLNFKTYGSDGRLSTSLLSQMIDQKGTENI